MMAFVRLLVPFGLMGFGAVAAFMGVVVLLNSAATGRVSYAMMSNGVSVTTSITKQDEPGRYWRALALAGGLPALLGLGAVWWGRRILHQ